MGLFDIFKKKDGAHYLKRAELALDQKRWVDARDDAVDGLRCEGTPEEINEKLRDLRFRANDGIVQLNLLEAGTSRDTGDYRHALECLETARSHALTEAEKAEVQALAETVKEHREAERKKAEEAQAALNVLPTFVDDEGEESELDEQFQIYLSNLATDVVAAYKTLGEEFKQGFVALNQGEGEKAMAHFETVNPQQEMTAGLLAFEKAKVLLMLNRPDPALLMLDLAGSVRGSTPIYTTGHPSIAFLRYEAFMSQQKVKEAADALREGLESTPEQQDLRVALASVLLSLRELDEAEALIGTQMACAASNPESHLLRARLQLERKDPKGAIATLEHGIKSCGCNPSAPPNPHLVRQLADVYLSEQQEPSRVEVLLGQLFRAQQGQGEWIDYFLRARFLKWQGDDELARASQKLALQQLPLQGDPRRRTVEGLFA